MRVRKIFFDPAGNLDMYIRHGSRQSERHGKELWDYEVEDVTAADLEKVKGYLAYDLQEKLIRRYMEWSERR